MKNTIQLITLFILSSLFILTISLPHKNDLIQIEQTNYEVELIAKENLSLSGDSSKDKLVSSVLMIGYGAVADGEFLPYGTASGFSVEYNKKTNTTYVLTNEHVCEDKVKDPELIIVGISSRNARAHLSPYDYQYVLSLVDHDKTMDLCLLETRGKISPVKFANPKKELTQMEQVFLIGAPAGNFPIRLDTYFSGFLSRGGGFDNMIGGSNRDYLLLSELVMGGYSGSPVFNKDGEVVGIVFASLGKNLGFFRIETYGSLAISLGDIKEFLQRSDIKI